MTKQIPSRIGECLEWRAKGLLSKQIADQMGIAERTVDSHFRKGLELTGCKTQHHLIAQFVSGEVAIAKPKKATIAPHGSKRTQLHAWLMLMGDWMYLSEIPHEQFGMTKETCSSALIDFCKQGRAESKMLGLKQYRAIPSDAIKPGPKPPKGLK